MKNKLTISIIKKYLNEYKYFYLYMLNIIFFAFIYSFFFDKDFKLIENISFVQAFYFSVVTVTTLGYGDIIPKLNVSSLLTIIIFQVMMGITFIGLFLNSLAQRVSDNKAKDNSILRANEYLLNNSSIKEEFIIVNKVANLYRLNKEYEQYNYILQDFYIDNQYIKDINFIDSKLYGLYIKKCMLHNILFINVDSDSSKFIDSKLKTCRFKDCSFNKVNFKESLLINIEFDNCILSRARFEKLHIQTPIIINSNLSGATFEESRIENANFKNSDFTNVNFKNSVLVNINFSGSIFKNNNFEGAILNNIYYNGKKVDSSNELK